MSIKDLFKDSKGILNVSIEEINSNIESRDFIEQKNKENAQFIPDLDFSTASNFARFGLAKEYYEQAIQHVCNTYPYDGSEKEITEWKNNLSYLEKYILEKEYPQTSGYLHLNNTSYASGTVNALTASDSSLIIISSSLGQYIKAFSGPNAYGNQYKEGNFYDPSNNRSGNFKIDPISGNTVEFWMKLNNNLTNLQKNCAFAIYDSWNLITNYASNSYTRFLINIVPNTNTFRVTYRSGTQGCTKKEITVNNLDLYNWHHYAITIKNNGSQVKIQLFIDGSLVTTVYDGTSITNNVVLKDLFTNIGSYCTTPIEGDTNFSSVLGWGQLPAKIDEFRFWKVERSQKQISRYRFDRVYGGTNSDNSNTNLGVYYRFNEGIIGNTTKDLTVLDYSGRVSNGSIVNYRINTRVTSSAIDESELFDSEEPKEPIIYFDNSLVSSVYNTLSERGEEWDQKNGNAIYKTLPEWISVEDEEKSTEELKKLTQIIANYLDKLYLQIKFLPTLSFADYPQDERKPVPFMNTILESNGLVAPDIFIDSSIFENIKNRDETRLFEEKLSDLKNIIYKNIYNNLTYIYKSKGTEKAFRNLIRCFGIDDELIKLNVYADNTEFTLQNDKKNVSVKKKAINLSTPDSFASNIYNTTDEDGASYGNSYVGSTLNSSVVNFPYWIVPLTFETSLHFPKKPPTFFNSYKTPETTDLSLFGAYTVNSTASQIDYSTINAQNYYNFEAFFIKNKKDDTGGYFKFNSILTNEILTSSYYSDVCDGENWTFAVRLKTPYTSLDVLTYDTGAFNSLPATGSYVLEFYGVNVQENIIKNEFTVTSSAIPLVSVKNIHNKAKRFYVGARRQNMTGSLQNYTDILVSNTRFWFDYLSNNEIIEHAKDPLNYGLYDPLTKPYENVGDKIERKNTLAFYWDFAQVTSSDINGKAYVKDIKTTSEAYDSSFDVNVSYRYPATVANTIPNYEEIVLYKYDLVSRTQLAENLYASNTVNVFGDSDTTFTKDTKPSNLFWSFEKSMYQIINEDVLNMFAGILDFNNLIGSPVNKYRIEYRELVALREKYFSKVTNSPSLERFLEYYKWIDSSIGNVINQLAPAGANISNNIRTIVESHALERPKIEYKLPIFTKDDKNYGQIKGIKELKYNWNKGHAPENVTNINLSDTQNNYSVWLKERAERNDSLIFDTGSAEAAVDRQTILNSLTNETNRKVYKVYDVSTYTVYNRSSYVERKLGRVIDISASVNLAYTDTVYPYAFGVGDQLTTSSINEIRPLFSGSDYARISLFNTK